jgi:NTP pyrophosphatase (non-canonical NTP hydrolase)
MDRIGADYKLERLMSFKPMQAEVDAWISQFEEGYFAPLPMLARVTEEVGELARVLMHHYGGKKPKAGEDPGDVGGEIADTIFVLLCLANSLEIDLDEKFAAMMTKYRVRDGERWTRR